MDPFMNPVHGLPRGPPLISEDEFNQRSKQNLGNLNRRICQVLLSELWGPHILPMFKFFSTPYQ